MKYRILSVVLLIALVFTTHGLTLAQDSATECEEGLRLFDHELLATDPVCIPEDPQQILVMDMAAMEMLLFTDKEVIGTLDWIADELSTSLPTLTPALAEVPLIGWPPNFELIVEAEPDLIVGYQSDTYFEAYDELSAIAPTVILSSVLSNWEPAAEFWAEVFNTQDVFAEMQATYESRITELQTALGEDRGELEISVVHSSPYFTLIWLAESAQGSILADAGLGRPESQSYSGQEAIDLYGYADYAAVSEETLNLADGDAIFLFSYATSDPAALEENNTHLDTFQANPLWQSLGAVQAGNAYVVGPHWYRAATYLLANAVIDDLFTYLTDVEPTIPNPIQTLEGNGEEG